MAEDNPYAGFLAPQAGTAAGNPYAEFMGGNNQQSQTIPQMIVGGLKSAGQYLGVPSEPIKNAAGEVVFPTNALERGLAASDNPSKEFAAAFVGGPGIKGNLPRVPISDVKSAATAVYNDPFNRSLPVMQQHTAGAVSDFKNEWKTYDPARYPHVEKVIDELYGKNMTVDKLDKLSATLGELGQEKQQVAPGIFQSTPQGGAALNLKAKVDKIISDTVPGWETADANYTAAKGAESLSRRAIKEEIRSEGRGMGFANRMQNAATQFRLDPRTQATLSPQQMAMLEGIQRGFPVLDTLKGALPGGVSGAVAGWTHGGPVGGMVGYGVGKTVQAVDNAIIESLKNRSAGRQSDALIQSLLQNSPYGKSLPINTDLATKQAIARALLYPQARRAFGIARADDDQQ